MKRLTCVVVLTVLALAASAISFAQEPGTMKGQMMGKGMKSGKMKMHPGLSMMKRMMSGQMVATKDGGVIVMMGNKLLKYDKNLNLKKEVKIKMDIEDMHKMMMQWKEKCQMYKKMMEESSGESTSAEEASE